MTETTMTIAQAASQWAETSKAYYETEDFENMYSELFLEDTTEADRHIKRILEEYYDLKADQCNQCLLDAIREHLIYEFEEYTDRFTNYWVGYYCVDSWEFGEREEEIPEEFQDQPEAIEAIEAADYFVSKDNQYAYYNMSGEGMRMTIPENDEAILKLIAEHTA